MPEMFVAVGATKPAKQHIRINQTFRVKQTILVISLSSLHLSLSLTTALSLCLYLYLAL